MAALHMTTYNAAVLLTDGAGGYAALTQYFQKNPQLSVAAKLEADVLAQEIKPILESLNLLIYVVTSFMVAGALLATANAMFSIVDRGRLQIATLRAIGFKGSRILVATLLETTILTLPGAVLGALLSWVFCNNGSLELADRAIPMLVTPSLMRAGIACALVVGLVGGFIPAVRSARMVVATALARR